MSGERIVAVALLTQAHLDRLGDSLRQVYAIDEAPCFPQLLRAIDEADREHWRDEDRLEALRLIRQEGG